MYNSLIKNIKNMKNDYLTKTAFKLQLILYLQYYYEE